jgi:hypothetical protein
MRLATISRILMPLMVATVLATGARAQEHVNITPGTVRDQLNQAGSSGSGSQAQPQQGPSQAEVKMPKKPAAPAKGPAPSDKAPAKAQAGAPAKPAAKAPAKEPAKVPAKASTTPPMKSAAGAPAKAPEKPAEAAKEPAKAAVAAPPTAAAEKAPEEKPVVRRDPFDTLLTKARATNAPTENLPPGKAIVSNAQQRVYFLRDGDKLYDGSVDKIALDSISFHEIGKDAFGKPLERSVTKQLYPSSGEQQ